MTFQPGTYYGGGFPRGVRRNPGGSRAGAAVKLLRELGLNWTDIAREVNISQRSLRKYHEGQCYPDAARMARLQAACFRLAGETV